MVKWIKTVPLKWVLRVQILSRGCLYFCFLFICYHKSWDRVIKMADNTSFKANWQWRIILHLRKRSCWRGGGSLFPNLSFLERHVDSSGRTSNFALENTIFACKQATLSSKLTDRAFVFVYKVCCVYKHYQKQILSHFAKTTVYLRIEQKNSSRVK